MSQGIQLSGSGSVSWACSVTPRPLVNCLSEQPHHSHHKDSTIRGQQLLIELSGARLVKNHWDWANASLSSREKKYHVLVFHTKTDLDTCGMRCGMKMSGVGLQVHYKNLFLPQWSLCTHAGVCGRACSVPFSLCHGKLRKHWGQHLIKCVSCILLGVLYHN